MSEQSSVSKIIKLTASRKNQIRLRSKEFNIIQIRDWERIFARIKRSDFLNGENNRNWVITFDWLFKNDTNFGKVIEGNFKNKRKSRTRVGGAKVVKGKYDDMKVTKI
jgi:hypothetical protein